MLSEVINRYYDGLKGKTVVELVMEMLVKALLSLRGAEFRVIVTEIDPI